MKLKLLLLCCLFWMAGTAQNLVSISPFTMPSNVPANTAEWGNLTSLFVLATANGTPLPVALESAQVSFTIKRGGSKVCGGTLQTAQFTTRNKYFKANDISGLLGGCILRPGTYQLCVQFFANLNGSTSALVPVSAEKCSTNEFIIENTGSTQIDTKYIAPQNISPTDKKEITDKEIKAPITFKWTPCLPKPQGPVTYRCKVWQLMQGQNGTTAMRSNQPIVTKEVENITQAVFTNLNAEPCMLPRVCAFVWNVEAVDAQGKVLGSSEATEFTLSNNNTQTYQPPVNQSPKQNQLITLKEIEKDKTITFRWAPLCCRPTEPPIYRLKVWQLMQGQTGTQAMKGKPVLTKDLSETEFAKQNLMGDIEKIEGAKIANGKEKEIIWCVQALNKQGELLAESKTTLFRLGGSSLSTASSADTCCRGFGAMQWGITPSMGTFFTTASASIGTLASGSNVYFNVGYNCNPLCPLAIPMVNYVFTQYPGGPTIGGTGGFVPAGSNQTLVVPTTSLGYCLLTIYGQCGTAPCDSAVFQIPVSSICCVGSTWGSQQFGTTTATTSSFLSFSGSSFAASSIAYFNMNYNCNTASGCTATFDYIISGGGVVIAGSSLYGVPAGLLSITMPSFPGNYTITINVYCGAVLCTSIGGQFTVISCCTGSSWGVRKYGLNVPATTIIPASPGVLGTITAGMNLNFDVSFNCAPGCGPATLFYNLCTPSGSLLASTSSISPALASLLIPSGLVTNTYIIKIYAKCGGVICDSLLYKLTVINCCIGSTWGLKQFHRWSTPIWLWPTLTCGGLNLGTLKRNKTHNFRVGYQCAIGCVSTITYTIKRFGLPVIGPISASGSPALTPPTTNIFFPLSLITGPGYTIEIKAYCNGILCATCINRFTLVP